MKKILFVLLILLLLFGGYLLFDNFSNRGIPKLDIEEDTIDIDELFIYGTNLNLHGSLINDDNLDLVLYNGEFIQYDINTNNDEFNLSDNINEGIYLEDVPIGKYYMFLRSSSKDEKAKDIYRYYALTNSTKYDETIYYTFSNTGNKITINSDEEYGTIMINVSKNKDSEIYDVVVDPGHGGIDSGAIKNEHYESDMTMKIALSLKEKLEDFGVKVKLTREDGQLTSNEKLNDYGTHGRAVISHEVKAKYLFSIHMNSNSVQSVNGLEIYTPANINYQFVNDLAKNITNDSFIKYSNKKTNKIFDGVYTRVFTENEIENAKKDATDHNRESYDITTKSNYYYMIRETGGIMTGAYVDNRNEDIMGNPYFNTNVGTEAYLLELGYLSNTNDLENMINNMDNYTGAIAKSFNSIFEKND